MNRRATIAAIVFAALFPTAVTWVYFDLLKDSPSKMVAYPVGKLLQFSFPVLWVSLYLRQRWKHAGIAQLQTPKAWSLRWSLSVGTLLGIAVVLAMWGVFRLIPQEVVQSLQVEVRERLAGFSADRPERFLGLALFYAIVHSFMEEYYFRWFIFGQVRSVLSLTPAMLVCGLAFMAHHVIVLHHYFPEHAGWTAFLSAAIAVGGMLWAFQYEKSKALIGPWLSHAIVDAGIFVLGYQLMFAN